MAIKFNRQEEIIAQAKAEGRFRVMDSPEAREFRKLVNAHAIEVRREFEYKERMSRIAAAKTILNA